MNDPEQITRPRLLRDTTAHTFNGIRVERHGKRIRVLNMDWDATTADGVGRLLTEMAEVAKAEPDPELLAALTTTMAEANILAFDAEDAEQVARKILARFNVMPRRGVPA